MWTTRQIYEQKGGLASRDTDGLRAGNWNTLAMLEKYIDYQCFLWKELQLNWGKWWNFCILRYWEIILTYRWFNLNFRLTKTDFSGLLNMHCTSALTIMKKYIFRKNAKLFFDYYPHCVISSNFQMFVQVIWKLIPCLVLYLSLLRIEDYQGKGGTETEQYTMVLARLPHPPSFPLPAFYLWRTLVKE